MTWAAAWTTWAGTWISTSDAGTQRHRVARSSTSGRRTGNLSCVFSTSEDAEYDNELGLSCSLFRSGSATASRARKKRNASRQTISEADESEFVATIPEKSRQAYGAIVADSATAAFSTALTAMNGFAVVAALLALAIPGRRIDD